MVKKERRIFERFIVGFPAKINHPGTKMKEKVQCYNISASGISIFTEQMLLPSLNLKLELKIPDGHSPFCSFARVVWSNKVEKNKWRSGLRFRSIDFMGIRRALETAPKKHNKQSD
jgi:hypothetical protein